MPTTSAHGDIFAQLGFTRDEAEDLCARAVMMTELRHPIYGLTRRDAATLLRTSEQRVKDLVLGRIDPLALDTLIRMLSDAELY